MAVITTGPADCELPEAGVHWLPLLCECLDAAGQVLDCPRPLPLTDSDPSSAHP